MHRAEGSLGVSEATSHPTPKQEAALDVGLDALQWGSWAGRGPAVLRTCTDRAV